jgi:hypothetical protein
MDAKATAPATSGGCVGKQTTWAGLKTQAFTPGTSKVYGFEIQWKIVYSYFENTSCAKFGSDAEYSISVGFDVWDTNQGKWLWSTNYLYTVLGQVWDGCTSGQAGYGHVTNMVFTNSNSTYNCQDQTGAYTENQCFLQPPEPSPWVLNTTDTYTVKPFIQILDVASSNAGLANTDSADMHVDLEHGTTGAISFAVCQWVNIY